MRNHKWHIEHLEQILRQLDNKILDAYNVEPTLDSIDEYLDNYRDKGYMFDDSIYDEFDLDVSLPESSSSEEEEEKEEKESKEKKETKEPPLKSGLRQFKASIPSSHSNAAEAKDCSSAQDLFSSHQLRTGYPESLHSHVRVIHARASSQICLHRPSNPQHSPPLNLPHSPPLNLPHSPQ